MNRISIIKPKYHIAVIDDNPSLLISLEMILSAEGYSVRCYDRSSDFVREYEANQFDLILTDVRIDNISGFELVDIVRKKDPRIKVCFISAFRNYFDSLASECPNIDYKYFMQKPIRRKELITKIIQILGE